MSQYFMFNMGVGLVGIVVALAAELCASGHAKYPTDTLFPGTSVPMSAIGVVGYILIALTALTTKWWPNFTGPFNHILVIGAGLFTIFLIVRSVQVGLVCPGCWLCWAINIILVLHLVFERTPT